MNSLAPTNLSPGVGNTAWLELLHAEICWALAKSDIPTLVIKGPSVSRWLYPDEETRSSVDVDVLVSPTNAAAASQVLLSLGFVRTYEGARPGETARHADEYNRDDDSLGRHGVDLHTHFPGMEKLSDGAFLTLWDERVEAELAHVSVWFPSEPARALIVTINAARELSPRTAEDLRRVMTRFEIDDWEQVIALASHLEALGPMRAGLETLPDVGELVQAIGLGDVEISSEWLLISHGANRTTLRLNDLRALPLRKRPGQIARWLVPSPAIMRARDPLASYGVHGLVWAYARRLGQGARELPGAISRARAARRG